MQVRLLPKEVVPLALPNSSKKQVLQLRNTTSIKAVVKALVPAKPKMESSQQALPSVSSSSSSASTSSSLPVWMMEYMNWHYEQRQTMLVPNKWATADAPKLLILQCTEQNVKCGGVSDRLKPIPLILLGAYQSKRILLIRWHRPAKLEEFMLPPNITTTTGATPSSHPLLDWRVPDWLDDILDNADKKSRPSTRHIMNIRQFMKHLLDSPKTQVVTTTLQWWDGGEQAYKDFLKLDQNSNEFRRVYHDLFRMLFQPTQPIQDMLNTVYETTALKGPNQYTVAHYRALWWEQQDPPARAEQEKTARNAVRCASQLQSTLPIYFATDSIDAQQSIVEYAQRSRRHGPIVVVPHAKLVHLDRVPNGTAIQDIYPVFVDLLLLGNGNCVSYGDGGFGKFGLMLSSNFTCSYRHIFRHKVQPCQWKT